jgi:hypothetical protein
MTSKDAFDLWWEWATKPLDSEIAIPVELHDAAMALTPDEGRNREKPTRLRARRGAKFVRGLRLQRNSAPSVGLFFCCFRLLGRGTGDQ